MAVEYVKVQKNDYPRFLFVRGTEGVVRVDVQKARKAMKHAMEIYEDKRAKDVERIAFIKSDVAE